MGDEIPCLILVGRGFVEIRTNRGRNRRLWTVDGFFNVSGFLPVDEDHVESDIGSINSVNKRSKKVDKLSSRGSSPEQETEVYSAVEYRNR